MELYPVFLPLRDRRCLVIGSGEYALSQASTLNQYGAVVTLVTSDVTSDVTTRPAGVTHLRQRPFQESDLEACSLVVIESDDETFTNAIMESCKAKGIFYTSAGQTADDSLLPGAFRTLTGNYSRQFTTHNENGHVSLVGAGPGDPELLTLRALKLIQAATVVVYDRLVSQPIMDMCQPSAQLIYAGKAKSDHTLPQASINQLLVDLANEGHNVVRLKGGDPFIFGRGGEEIETLAEQEISFEVVPGITAASGCSAFAGIPLTHRDHAQSCIFITGHLRSGEVNLDWERLQDPNQTIVVYMGLTGLDKICKALIDIGRDPATKAALVERGTTPGQQVHTGTLTSLPGIVMATNVSAPTLLIIGDVVGLRGKLQWFEKGVQ